MSSDRLAELARTEKWFHAIDFGNTVSPGRFPPTVPPNYTLYGVFELLSALKLEGITAVDVGTMDGLVAFILKRLGAKHVIATDLARRATFEAGRASLNLDIDYRVPLSAVELPAALEQPVDLIVLAGILYHVFDPIGVLEACRRAVKREGMLIVETMYLFDEGHARMSFNPSDETSRGNENANVFWRPSRTTVEGMLQLVGFEVITSIAVDGRLTVLAQAKRAGDMTAPLERVRRFHRQYGRYTNYRENIDLDRIKNDQGIASTITYAGPRGHRRIYPAFYAPKVPFQARWDASPRLQVSNAARSAVFHVKSVLADGIARVRRRTPR